MAENILDVRLKQRYDTEANWTSINPVLLAGELAISSDKDGKYKVGNGSSKWSELSYAYQSGLDAKQNTITGGATTITSSNLTANRALISNGSGKVAVSEVTGTELGYLDGVTSNVQTQLDNKLSNCLVQTASGTAIVAQDSSDDPARGLRMFGRTEQVTTTGKNLFNPENVLEGYFRENISITITSNTRTVYASCLPDTTYTISKTAGARFFVGYTSEIPTAGTLVSGVINNSEASAITITTGSDAVYLVAFIYISTADTITAEEMLASVQIELGDTATDWEPYTGGIPSPNPDYPQELVSVGDSGSVKIDVYGSNLLDYEQWKKVKILKGTCVWENNGATLTATDVDCYTGYSKENHYKTYCIPCNQGETFILTWEHTGSAYDRVFVFYNGNDGNNKSILSKYGQLEFTIPEDCTFFTFRVGCYIAGTTSYYKNVRLSLKDARDFEPYTHQSLAIQTPNGLPGIPVTDASLANYTDESGQMWCSDEVDLERGVYVQRVKYINNIIPDGMETTEHFGYLNINDLYENNRRVITLSNRYKYDKSIKNDGICFAYEKVIRFYIDEAITTMEEMKEYFTNNPTDCIYPLATPIETPLTSDILSMYSMLHSNYPVTTVLNDAGAYMELKYNTNDGALIRNVMSDLTDEHIVSITADGKDLTYTKGNGTTTIVDTQQNFITLTKVEYDALISAGAVDEDCYYFVTDDANTSPLLIQYITFAASGWTASDDGTYYTQSATATQITADDEPMVVKNLPYSTVASTAKAYNKAFGILTSGVGETADGVVNWKCYKKPATDITVGLIKVMA